MNPDPRVTLADVAREASVSVMTVSNALNRKPGVSERTRLRVLEAATRLGYVPNMAARGLAGGRTHMVGVLINDLTVQWASEVVAGIAEVTSDRSLELLISATYRDSTREAERISLLGQGLVDGLILVSPVLEAPALELVSRLRVPAVVVDPRRLATPLPNVTVSNYLGARSAVEHLLDLGHRAIAIVSGDDSFDSARERLRGYADALAARGVAVDPALVLAGDYTQARAREEATELLRSDRRPTAIFATSDGAAFGVMDAARSIGLQLPSDLSIVGFDDIPAAATAYPALTTVHAPLRDMGRLGAGLLLALLDDPEGPAESRELPTRLISRESAITLDPLGPEPRAASSTHDTGLHRMDAV